MSYFIYKNCSKSTTLDLVDQVLEDHDIDVLAMKEKVASRDIPGVCFFGDNIGLSSNLRF